MRQRVVVGGVALVMMLSLAGCGSSAPSLTAAELAQKYPDKRYVQVNGVALHYEQEGLGQPLVLLHGLLTSSYLWRNVVPGLTYGSTIYNLDLMGFGLSEKPQNVTYSLDTYVGQLGKFLDDFHLENPILVGHDVSGLIATLYTIRNPRESPQVDLGEHAGAWSHLSIQRASAAPVADRRPLHRRLVPQAHPARRYARSRPDAGCATQRVPQTVL